MRTIELFDEYTARILAGMYSEFPIRTYLDARGLSGHDQADVYGRVLNERGDPSKEFETGLAAIHWLWETGYIRAEGKDSHGLMQAVLSPMGFSVLKAAPSSLTIKEITGDRLASLVKEGSMSAAADLVKATIVATASFAKEAAADVI